MLHLSDLLPLLDANHIEELNSVEHPVLDGTAFAEGFAKIEDEDLRVNAVLLNPSELISTKI